MALSSSVLDIPGQIPLHELTQLVTETASIQALNSREEGILPPFTGPGFYKLIDFKRLLISPVLEMYISSKSGNNCN